jgi:hypothetical protein
VLDKPLAWLGSARRDVGEFHRYRALINEKRADDAKNK